MSDHQQQWAPDGVREPARGGVNGSGSALGRRTSRALRKDWFEYLGLDGYCCSLVRGVSERDALLRIGIQPESIHLVPHYLEVLVSALQYPTLEKIVVADLGGWKLLVERNSAAGLEQVMALSQGTEVIVAQAGSGGKNCFRYVRDGVIVTAFEDGDLGHLVGWGTEPEVLAPFIDQIGSNRFREFDEDGATPDLELACLVSGVSPRQEDFESQLLCGYVSASSAPPFQHGWSHRSTA